MNVIRWIDWRIGRRRLVLPAAVHVLATIAAIDLAREGPLMWRWIGVATLSVVVLSAIIEGVHAFRERGAVHELGLCPGGITVDALEYRARRAWLGPGWTAVWLTANGRRRRLLSVWRGEVTEADHAALRRHVKALDFT